MMLKVLLLFADSTMPDISPDFSAPFFSGLTRVASWVLAAGLIVAFIALVLAICALLFKGVSSPQMRAAAGAALPVVLIALIALAASSGLFEWLVGFDFGFGTVLPSKG